MQKDQVYWSFFNIYFGFAINNVEIYLFVELNMVEYSLNLHKLEQNYNGFESWGEVFFPVKTNHNKIVLNKLKKLGSGFECDSLEHIKKVYSRKNANKIIFSNVAKSKDDIDWVISHGLSFFTIDDRETLLYIIKVAKENGVKMLKINIRLNVYDIFAKEFAKKGVVDSRLGASVEEIKRVISLLKDQKNIRIEYGISFYVQAEVHDNKKMLIDVSDYLKKHFDNGCGFGWVNIGGGSSLERLDYSKKKLYENMLKIGVSKIILEPGRYMMGDVEDVSVGVIRCVKKETNNETVVSLEMGIYHGLIDIKLHNRKLEFYVKNGRSLIKLEKYRYGEKLVLRGPTADSIDILGEYQMPKMTIDDKTTFTIKNVGAYVEVLNSDFSGSVTPKYIII